MRKFGWLLGASLFAVLSACVTINVYFPAAAAEEAAAKFIDQVIGEQGKAPEGGNGGSRPPQRPLSLTGFFIADAHAQADLEIETPQIKAIQARMADRFRGTLEAHFASGALGFTRDGKVAVRDAAAIPLAQRAAVNQSVADENRDRDAVYREIAIANGHPEWEADIRATFARQWVERAPAGWYHQDANGAWVRR